jgi:hypothetical protein
VRAEERGKREEWGRGRGGGGVGAEGGEGGKGQPAA